MILRQWHPSDKAAWHSPTLWTALASLAMRLLPLDSTKSNTAATYVPSFPFSLLPLLINFSSDFLNNCIKRVRVSITNLTTILWKASLQGLALGWLLGEFPPLAEPVRMAHFTQIVQTRWFMLNICFLSGRLAFGVCQAQGAYMIVLQ